MTTLEGTLGRDDASDLPWSLITIFTTTVILLLPALWNGYPLTYYDSADYVVMPFTWHMPVYRTAGYGVFALASSLTHSMWGIVIAQSLMIAYVLHETFQVFAPAAQRRVMLAATLLLSLITGVAWASSEVMPDAFTGAVVLATFILAYEDGRLGWARRVALAAILAIAIVVHTTHFAIVGGLLICFAVSRWLARRSWPLLAPKLRMAAISFTIAVGLAFGSNWLMTGKFFIAQPSAVLTVGLLVQDGIAKRYLDEVCPKPGIDKPRLCLVRKRLPDNANQFLWHDADFWKLGGWLGYQSEAARIVEACLERYPFIYAWTSLKLTIQQLMMVESGDGVTPMQFFIGKPIRRYFPQEVGAFSHAHQQSGGIDFTSINRVQLPVLYASYVLLSAILWFGWRRRDLMVVTLSAMTLLAELGNAFVCGALSNPNDRYGSRIAWVGVLVILILLPRLIALWRPHKGTPG